MRPTDALDHPPDWAVTTVGRAIEIKRGLSWSKDQERDGSSVGTVPVLRISNIQNRLNLEEVLHLSGVPQKARELKKANKGWTIIVGSNGNRQRIGNAVFQDVDTDFLFASFLIAARPKSDSSLLPAFFYRWLCTHEIQARLSASAEGSTGLSNLSHDFFKAMEIAHPEPDEQAGIVRVLDAADLVIERTRVAYITGQRLKRGLLQRIFSDGLHGQTYKTSELGRVPSTWDVIKGKHAFQTMTGYAPSAIRFAREGQPSDAWFMKVDDFNDPANSRKISRTKLAFSTTNNPKVQTVPIGTLIIAKRGAAIEKNRVRITSVPIALDPNLMGLHLSVGIDPEFFRFQLEWRRLARYMESSGVPQLNNKDLYPRWFLRPPLPEQLEIVRVIQAAEQREDKAAISLARLELLKCGLMHDLLTGRVRVTHLVPSESSIVRSLV